MKPSTAARIREFTYVVAMGIPTALFCGLLGLVFGLWITPVSVVLGFLTGRWIVRRFWP